MQHRGRSSGKGGRSSWSQRLDIEDAVDTVSILPLSRESSFECVSSYYDAPNNVSRKNASNRVTSVARQGISSRRPAIPVQNQQSSTPEHNDPHVPSATPLQRVTSDWEDMADQLVSEELKQQKQELERLVHEVQLSQCDRLLRAADQPSRHLMELCSETHEKNLHKYVNEQDIERIKRGVRNQGKYGFHDELHEFDDSFNAACLQRVNSTLVNPNLLPSDYTCSAAVHDKNPDSYNKESLHQAIREAPPHSRERKEAQFLLLAWTSAKTCETFKGGSETRAWMNYDFKWMLHQSRNALAHAPLHAQELELVQAWAGVLTDGDLGALQHFLEQQAKEMEAIKQRFWKVQQ